MFPPIGPLLATWGSGGDAGTGEAVWSFAGPVVLAGVLLAATGALRRRRA